MEPSKNTERVAGRLDDVRARPERDAEGTDPVYCRSERAFGTRTVRTLAEAVQIMRVSQLGTTLNDVEVTAIEHG